MRISSEPKKIANVLIDFDEAFKSKTGIPLSTVIDATCIIKSGANVALWTQKGNRSHIVREWIDSTFSEDEKFRVRIIDSRPSNLKMWMSMILGIKMNIVGYDFFYQRLFMVPSSDGSVQTLLRIDDPFGASSTPIKSLFKDFHNKVRPKSAIARFIRTLAYKRLSIDETVIHVFNSKHTNKLWESVYGSILNHHVVYPPVQFSLTSKEGMAGIDITNHLKDEQIHDVPYFVIVGGQRQRKDPASIINAWSETEFSRKAKIRVVGTIPIQYFTLSSRTLVDSGFVCFHNNLDAQDLKSLISNSIALIFNSNGEGFGNPIAEAQYLNIPVICNDLEPFKEIGLKDTFFYKSGGFASAINLMIQKLDEYKPRTHPPLVGNSPFSLIEGVRSWGSLIAI